jgi:hypothetical protein
VSRPLRFPLTPPRKHGYENAGQLSVKKQPGFSALEVADLLVTNPAPSKQQWQDLLVTTCWILC